MKKLFKALVKSLLFLCLTVAAVFLPPYLEISETSMTDPVIISPTLPLPAESTDIQYNSDGPLPEFNIDSENIYDLMLDSTAGPLTYYNQADARWGDYLYGGRDPIKKYGCGPTVMAMLITSLTGRQVFPNDISDWAAANGCWCPAQGSYHCLIPDSAAAFGLTATPLKDYTAEAIIEALSSGKLIVALVRPGHFTAQGHFIILCQFTEEGKILIADSNRYENTLYEWDPEIIISELNYQATNGGPLWMIGLP